MTSNERLGKLIHTLAVASILGAGALFLVYAMSSSNAANRDFISYWSVGKQLIHHGNPYDGPAILKLEKDAGFSDAAPFFMRNPPIAFFLMLPLALLSVKMGAVVWSLAIIAALMISVRMLWKMHGRPRDSLHLIGYLFPPALACLLAGQIGIFLLLGVVLFLALHATHPYVAGASLLLCAMKPHLLIPFGMVLLVWSVASRTYRILVGASVAIGSSLLLSYVVDAQGWSQYEHMVEISRLQDQFVPTLSLYFRLLVHRDWVWLQIVPSICGAIWATLFFLRNKGRWEWSAQGMPLLLLSVMVAPYAWFTDEAMLLPAILASLYLASDLGRSLVPYVIIAGIALIEVLAGVRINSPFYLWTSPAWLMWYLWASRPFINLREREADAITL